MQTVVIVICGVLYGLIALLLLGAVLVQESKGGGLAALGGTRAESAFGASNPMRKLTTVLAIFFFLLASALAIWLAPEKSVTERIQKAKPILTPKETGKDKKEEAEKEKSKGVSVTVPIKDAKDEDKDKDKKGDPNPGEKPAAEPKKDAAGEKKPADK